MAMLLDLRTLPCNNVDKDVRNEAVRLLKLAYVEFGVKCLLYDREKKASSSGTPKLDSENVLDVVALKLKSAHGTSLDATATTFDPVGTWSDDEIGDGGNAGGVEVEESMDVVKEQLRDEFDVKFRAWRGHPAKINWSKVDPNVEIRDPSSPDMLELMGMNISALYRRLEENDHSQFGHIPVMASCSKGQVGALNAESFCERCMSCANLVVDEGNTILLDEEVTMMTVLRMNVEFMEFMRENYGQSVVKQPWKMTIVD